MVYYLGYILFSLADLVTGTSGIPYLVKFGHVFARHEIICSFDQILTYYFTVIFAAVYTS